MASLRSAQAKVWFVGAGPGAADLLTLRALRVLRGADVVLHDALITDELLEWAPSALRVPVGKRCDRPSLTQGQIGQLLLTHARQGGCIVRLKGGDPTVFGRLDEEIDLLDAAGIAWEIVPGVTAASAAAAAAGHSLTRRAVARQLTLATPRVARDGAMAADWADGLSPHGTVVIYMAGRLGAECARQLITRGFTPDTPVVMVRAASWPDQDVQRLTLQALSLQPVSTDPRPVVLMVGKALNRPFPAAPIPQTREARLQSGLPEFGHSACSGLAPARENPGRSQESPVPAAQPIPA
jgi:uroporphyrin-III C-methyltransferase